MVPRLIRKPLLAACLSVLCGAASAELVLVVHPSNASDITSKNAKRIFLGKEKKFSNGNPVVPINQAANAVRNDFDSAVLGKSSTQVSAYWSKLVFTGKGIPPKEVNNDAEVIAAVAADANAIGYVDSASVTADVKSVAIN